MKGRAARGAGSLPAVGERQLASRRFGSLLVDILGRKALRGTAEDGEVLLGGIGVHRVEAVGIVVFTLPEI